MDTDPEKIISDKLNVRPIKISAGPVCASNRDSLFWCNFPIAAKDGESLVKDKERNELVMSKDPKI